MVSKDFYVVFLTNKKLHEYVDLIDFEMVAQKTYFRIEKRQEWHDNVRMSLAPQQRTNHTSTE